MGRDELADKTGLSVRTIRRLEQGEHVSTRALDRILEVLLLDLTPVRRVVEVQS
jgi:transcriptional regulator with XRE-family HTH domain